MSPLHITLTGERSSVPTARRFVEDALQQWQLDALEWTATLVVSELAANVALHARTEFTVRLSRTSAGGVRLEVQDGSSRAPRQRHYADDATTGRGLRLVEQVASRWGVTRSRGGKSIWVEIEPAPPNGHRRQDEQVDADPDLDAVLAMFPDEPDAFRALVVVPPQPASVGQRTAPRPAPVAA